MPDSYLPHDPLLSPSHLLQYYCQVRLFLPNTYWNIYPYLGGTIPCISVYQTVLSFSVHFPVLSGLFCIISILLTVHSQMEWTKEEDVVTFVR